MTAPVSDFIVASKTIEGIFDLDLAEFVDLPSTAQELVALSLRMDAHFAQLCGSVLALIAQEHDDIPSRVFEEVTSRIALDFIERYGLLAFLSGNVLRALWPSQRPKCAKGPARLMQVGERLAIFAKAAKGIRPMKSIDIGFALGKRDFLLELQRLSRELGASESEDPWVDQLLDMVKEGDYTMLKLNFRLLEQFLRCQVMNPRLQANNAIAAERLAEHGIGLLLREKRERSMSPDSFFYAWTGWATNKAPTTVRREIQTAKRKLERSLARVTKER